MMFAFCLLSSCSDEDHWLDGYGEEETPQENNNKPAKYFTNPVRPVGADPWVIREDAKYYFSESDGGTHIYVHEFDKISEMSQSQGKLVHTTNLDPNLKLNSTWGPHINKINGQWYIYFCATTNPKGGSATQRMWVLQSGSPFGPYENKGEVLDSKNTEWAIDGSVLVRENGDLYFVWSGISKEDTQPGGSWMQRSFIAKMLDPTRIDRNTITEISQPTEVWEQRGAPIQEGQRPLYVDHNGKTIVMYSASASWTDDYCLGSLTNTDGDFLNPSSWVKSKEPLFQKTEAVWGPGGASYVKSVDGKEDWIIYHAAREKGSGWQRSIRAQKFTFDKENNPIFGDPIAPGVKMQVPSGE